MASILVKFPLRTKWVGCLLAAALAATSSADAFGQAAMDVVDAQGIRPDHIWTGAYAQLVWGDTVSIVTAPARWDGAQWLEAGGAVALVAVAVPFDQSIRDHVQAHHSAGSDRFFKDWQNLGSGASFAILAGFEVWGEIGNDTQAKNVAMDGLAASIIASGLITPTLKYAVGRERPNSNRGAFKFRPFSSNVSFPSGHATQAFAVATVIAENYPSWWVGTLAYGSAALVGYTRIEQDAHFTSDVVAGAIIGWSVARSIVRRHDGPRDPKRFSWSPYVSGSGGGIAFFKSF